MYRRWQVISSIVLALVLWISMVGFAQAQSITYIPHVETKLTQYPPIRQSDCPEGFVLSEEFPNGTTSSFIYQYLGIHPQDLHGLPINRERLSEGMISSYTEYSPICWLGNKYPSVFLENVDEVAEPLNLYFPEGRGAYFPSDNLTNVNQVACSTISVVLTAAEATWQGAPIIGALRRGFSEIVGKIICNVSSYVPQGIWSKAAYAYPIGMAATQMYEASTEGLLVPPSLLNEAGTIAVFYYAVDVDQMYPKCSMDAILEADRMQVPRIRRLILIGFEDAGCIFSDEPFYEGQRSLPLDLLNKNVLMLAAYMAVLEKTPSYEEAQEILRAWEEEINREESPESFWVPERNPNECSSIPVPVYVQATVNETYVHVEGVLRYRQLPTAEMMHLIQFASEALDLPQDFEFEATYATTRPFKDGTRARLVSNNVDFAGNKWAVDLICYDSGFGHIWLGLETGRAFTGLLRSDRDNVDAFPNR